MKIEEFWSRICGLDLISGAYVGLCWADLPDHARGEVELMFSAAMRAGETSGQRVGKWVSVEDDMPDDEISVLVWSEHLGEACTCFHDSEVRERRGDSGWIMVGTSRVVMGVTHWCGEVLDPNTQTETLP